MSEYIYFIYVEQSCFTE